MGAVIRQNDTDHEVSATERLFNWITKVRTKKIKYLRSRKRNIRVEAVLANALFEAEQELRRKQVARINRWQQLKLQMANNNNDNGISATNGVNTVNDNANGTSKSVETSNQDGVDSEPKKVWSGETFPELSSLDSFISKLSSIKSPVNR